MNEEIKNPNSNLVKPFLKNLCLEFLFTIILLMALSIILSSTSVSENIINPSIIFISAFSILIGSFFTGKKIGNKGILIGILQGFVYMFILYLCSSILSNNFSLGISSIIMILISLICGAIGGILGVNLSLKTS